MNWEERNVSVTAVAAIHRHFSEAKILLSSGSELSFLKVVAAGEALVQKGKNGKFIVLDLNITLDFKLKHQIANGSVALTGQFLIRNFSGKEEMSTRVICDETRIVGAEGDLATLMTRLAEAAKKEGLQKVKDWLGGAFIESLVNLDSPC